MSTLETKQDTSHFDVSVQIPRSDTSINIHEVAPQIGSLPSNLQFGAYSSANLHIGSLPTGLQLGEQLPSFPVSLAAYRSHRNSLSWEDASVYESDRPHSVRILFNFLLTNFFRMWNPLGITTFIYLKKFIKTTTYKSCLFSDMPIFS